MRAQEAADRFPLPRVAGCFELLSHPAQQMEGEHTDKNMPIHEVFKLVVVCEVGVCNFSLNELYNLIVKPELQTLRVPFVEDATDICGAAHFESPGDPCLGYYSIVPEHFCQGRLSWITPQGLSQRFFAHPGRLESLLNDLFSAAFDMDPPLFCSRIAAGFSFANSLFCQLQDSLGKLAA